MTEIAIFTEETAAALIERGFECLGTSDKAWFFEDTPLLLEALETLVKE